MQARLIGSFTLQVVLSACSSYFQKLLLSNPCKHPTIIMPQDVCFNDLKFIIEFVYKGEIDVSQAELQVNQIPIKLLHFSFNRCSAYPPSRYIYIHEFCMDSGETAKAFPRAMRELNSQVV